MQSFSLICLLAAMAGLVSVGLTFPQVIDPIAQPEDNVAKRAEPAFYFCNQANWLGRCFRDRSAFGTCVTVQDDFIGVPDESGSSVSSVIVNNGTRCTLYRDDRCEGPNKIRLFSGEHGLFFRNLDDVMGSFRCLEL